MVARRRGDHTAFSQRYVGRVLEAKHVNSFRNEKILKNIMYWLSTQFHCVREEEEKRERERERERERRVTEKEKGEIDRGEREIET